MDEEEGWKKRMDEEEGWKERMDEEEEWRERMDEEEGEDGRGGKSGWMRKEGRSKG